MPTIATCMREIGNKEGFDVVIHYVAGPQVGLDEEVRPHYSFDLSTNGGATVHEWLEGRFKKTYPNLTCKVLNEDGSVADANDTLSKVRETYAE